MLFTLLTIIFYTLVIDTNCWGIDMFRDSSLCLSATLDFFYLFRRPLSVVTYGRSVSTLKSL